MKHFFLTTAFAIAGASALAQNNNCATATQVCNNSSFSGNSAGFGIQEMPNNNTVDGCLTVEHQSSWYYFQPVTSGTVALTIQTTVDYDFAIWTGTCSSLGSPVRCSYASQTGNTGLAATNSSGVAVTDVSEGTGGDRWVTPLNVVAGQTYIMLIDNFTANSTPFTLVWTFSGGATLNCNPITLPVELLSFMGNYHEDAQVNLVQWTTASERENDSFTLERSADGHSWQTISVQDGAGTSNVVVHYTFEDRNFEQGKVNYYRLTQTDINGTEERFDIISLDNTVATKKVVKVVNLMGQEVPEGTPGLLLLLYEDGTVQRVYR